MTMSKTQYLAASKFFYSNMFHSTGKSPLQIVYVLLHTQLTCRLCLTPLTLTLMPSMKFHIFKTSINKSNTSCKIVMIHIRLMSIKIVTMPKLLSLCVSACNLSIAQFSKLSNPLKCHLSLPRLRVKMQIYLNSSNIGYFQYSMWSIYFPNMIQSNHPNRTHQARLSICQSKVNLVNTGMTVGSRMLLYLVHLQQQILSSPTSVSSKRMYSCTYSK